MARERNITAADKFFLGEDKYLDLTIYGTDDVTPLDVAGLPLEWSLKNHDKDPDPGILEKATSGGGITVIGVYNSNPATNTQKVRIAFISAETDPFVTGVLVSGAYTLKAGKQYRHSLKRRDFGNEGVLTYGSWEFRQATEP